MRFDDTQMSEIKSQFPALSQLVYGKPLVYLDSGATSQTPNSVVKAICHYYQKCCANVHRGTHKLTDDATLLYEASRKKIQKFVNAKSDKEVIFTKGTTDSINLVAATYGEQNIQSGDEILVSEMEHHSNIVPWQLLCERKGATLKVLPMGDAGEFDMATFESHLGANTKLFCVAHVSNALGTINPLKEMIQKAHAKNIKVMVDGAQAAPHGEIDVQDFNADFYAFSAHKMYGPTGIGVLVAKEDLLDAMPPYQGGGDMIATVDFAKSTYAPLPYKFEAGTPNVAGVIGFGAAVDFMDSIGRHEIMAHESELLEVATKMLKNHPRIKIIGQAKHKASVLSFTMDGVHPHDISSIVDRQGVAIRAGHLCAQPVMKHFGIAALARASFGVYNTLEDVEKLGKALEKVGEIF